MSAVQSYEHFAELGLLDVEQTKPELIANHHMGAASDVLNSAEEIDVAVKRFSIGNVGIKSVIYRPERVIDETPILVVKGFCASRKAYSTFARSIAAHGRIVATYGTDRHESIRDPLQAQAEVAIGVGRVIMRTEDIDQIDTIGHSMGNSIQSRAAALSWRHVRSMMATGGAGLYPYGFFNMAGKLGGTAGFEVAPNASRLHRKSAAGLLIDECLHMGRNLPLLVSEGVHTAIDDVHPYIEKAKDKGVRVGATMFERDTFFKPNDVLGHSGHLFDYYNIIPGALHVHPQIHPFSHGREQVAASQELNKPQLTVVGTQPA